MSQLPEPGLPVRWYVDDEVWAAERELLFDLGPGYVAHRLAVPHPGDHTVSPVVGDGWALVNDAGRPRLVSNVCRHRQATMVTGCGRSRTLVCPLHRWSYGLDGRLRCAPHFPERPALDLAVRPLQDWHGLLFAGPRDVAEDLAPLGLAEAVRAEGYVRQRVEVERYEANWKTFIEVYLEDYHVVPFHPGLRGFTDCDRLRWSFAPWGSVQWVGVADGLERPGSPAYDRWHAHVRRHGDPHGLEHAAVWATYFPNVTVEWYPHTLVVSSVVPDGPHAFTNVIEYLYPADLLAEDPGFAEAQQAAYAETAVEDREIIERMHAGRVALHRDGRDERGPYQTPLEDGLEHFHAFLWEAIGPAVEKPEGSEALRRP